MVCFIGCLKEADAINKEAKHTKGGKTPHDATSVTIVEGNEDASIAFGDHQVQADGSERPFDLPWVVLDSSRAESLWSWRPQTSWQQICEEIAEHARLHPHWMQLSHGG